MNGAISRQAHADVTLPDAEEIIRRQRKALGKPIKPTPKAIDLVCENEVVIRQLRTAGYKQEDAVLLLLELGNESHMPDTLRKAIAAVLGPWINPNGHTAEAAEATTPSEIAPPVKSRVEAEENRASAEGGVDISEGDYL
ncbi:hypothetical protein [Roseibium sp.]|uniref:hypothetical protein n=1 Tax=Roseibium sp. TaxID=1936156 RepID=UPI0032999D7A